MTAQCVAQRDQLACSVITCTSVMKDQPPENTACLLAASRVYISYSTAVTPTQGQLARSASDKSMLYSSQASETSAGVVRLLAFISHAVTISTFRRKCYLRI